MSDITKDQVVDWLSNQSVIDIAELVKELEEKWGVSAAAPAAVAVAAQPGADAGGSSGEAKSEFDVILAEFGGNKIAVIKDCLLYTSPSPRDGLLSRMPSSA